MNGIVIRSDFLLNLIFWMNVDGVALYPFIIVRNNSTKELVNHERIHLAQYRELWVVGMIFVYNWYILRKWFGGWSFFQAYLANPLEIEAYLNMNNFDYLSTRKKSAWKVYRS